MPSKFLAILTALVTVIGRVGVVFLGMQMTLIALGMGELSAFMLTAVIAAGAFVSYFGLIGKQTLRLFNSLGDRVYKVCVGELKEYEGLEEEQEKLIVEKTFSIKYKVGFLLAKTLGWGLGITTAGVESIATYVGWNTLLNIIHVPPEVATVISMILGGGSIVGWIALAGFPTAKVISNFYEAATNNQKQQNEAQSEGENIHVLMKVFGAAIAIVTGVGTGSVAFFAIMTALENTRFANNYLPGFLLSPCVMIAASSLYYTRLPKELKKIPHIIEHYKGLRCGVKPVVGEAVGTGVEILTGCAAYLLVNTSARTLCEAIGLSETFIEPVVVNTTSLTMASVATLVTGVEGYRLAKSPYAFFSTKNSPNNPNKVIDEESQCLVTAPGYKK